MTVKDYVSQPDADLSVNIWSSDACRGYVLSAMLAAGINRATVPKIMASLEAQLMVLSVDKAEALVRKKS